MSLISNFPNGFSNGVTIRGMPLALTHPGKVFWVGNSTTTILAGMKGASNSNDGTFMAPWSTVTYAISQCVANRGDVIMVRPGHAENLATAAVIASNIAGVAIIGTGTGAAVPTFTWTAVAGTWTVTAANCSFVNLKFVANFADVTTLFDVSGAGDGLTFQDCLFTDTDSTHNALTFITAATGADDFTMVNCRVVAKATTALSVFSGVAHDRMYVSDCQFQFNGAQGVVTGLFTTSGNATNVWIKDSLFVSSVDGASFIDFNGAACSGAVTNCYFSSLDVAGAVTAGFDFTGGHIFECYVAGEPDTYGIIGGGVVYNNA